MKRVLLAAGLCLWTVAPAAHAATPVPTYDTAGYCAGVAAQAGGSDAMAKGCALQEQSARQQIEYAAPADPVLQACVTEQGQAQSYVVLWGCIRNKTAPAAPAASGSESDCKDKLVCR